MINKENKRKRCIYFEAGRYQNLCRTYPQGCLMVPSVLEEREFCKTSSYILCDFYINRKGEEYRDLIKV